MEHAVALGENHLVLGRHRPLRPLGSGGAASVALTATPMAFGPEHVDRLRRSGLDDLAIADVIQAAAFFNWANRLMLSLGEPAAAAPA